MDTAPTRLLQVLTVVMSAVLVACGSFVAYVFVALVRCGGDGGVPYSADDSPAGRLCRGSGSDVWLYAVMGVPLVVLLILGVIGVLRARWLWVGLAALAGFGATFALFVALLALPASCSEGDQRAYDEWSERGRLGEQPADCQTY